MQKLRRSTLTALFAAVIFLMTFFARIPAPSGYVHFGDGVLYLFALMLGMPWAAFAGIIGEGLADLMSGFAVYAPATAVIKLSAALLFSFARGRGKLLSLRSALMTIPAGALTVGGYFLADLVIDRAYAFVDIPGNAVQAFASAVIFILLAGALDASGASKRIGKL